MEGEQDLKVIYGALRSRAERILLVVDLSQELTKPGLGKNQRWDVVVEMLKLFVEQKLLMDAEHEIGIALLTQGEVTLLCEFTSNVKTVLSALGLMQPMDASEGYDISLLVEFVMRLQKEKSLFQTANSVEVDKLFRMFIGAAVQHTTKHAEQAETERGSSSSTCQIVIYGRSSKVPHFSAATMEELQRNPTAFCDLVFIHGGGREDADGVASVTVETTQQVLSWLVEHFESLQVRKTCYCVEASTNYERFVRQFVTLLAYVDVLVIVQNLIDFVLCRWITTALIRITHAKS